MTQDFEPLEPADDEADPVIACEECDELQGIINDAVSELRAISPFESELRSKILSNRDWAFDALSAHQRTHV